MSLPVGAVFQLAQAQPLIDIVAVLVFPTIGGAVATRFLPSSDPLEPLA